MTSTQDETETTTQPITDTTPVLPPLEIPQDVAPLAETASDDALQFDEPSSALASRVLSAHDNPSPPPSPLLQADLSIFSEQRSVSPIRPVPPSLTPSQESEGSRDDVLDMEEVENSLVLEQVPESEAPTSDAAPINEPVDFSGSEKENSLPPVDGITVVEPVPEPIQTTPLLVAPSAPSVPEISEETTSQPSTEEQQQQQSEQPTEPLDTPSKTPRRSTRPRKSLNPFGLSVTSTPISTPPSNSKSKGSKGKEKVVLEATPPALPELPQNETSTEKKQRRKERSRSSQGSAEPQLRSLSPGSSALLTQLVSGSENSNPFDDIPKTPPPTRAPLDTIPESDTLAGPADPLATPVKTADAAPTETPKRFPIRPVRQTTNEEVKQSPSPRRVPLNQATPGVRKVMQSQIAGPIPAKGLFASHVPLPTLTQPSHKSPSRVTSSSPLRSPKKSSAPPPATGTTKQPRQGSTEPHSHPSPAPEGSNTSSLPFPITASKPPSSSQKSRVPVSSSVVRQKPSRIPRIGSKPYARAPKVEATKTLSRLPGPTKKTYQQTVTEVPSTVPTPKPPQVSANLVTVDASSQGSFKRKRETQPSDSHLPKRKKLSPEPEVHKQPESLPRHDDSPKARSSSPAQPGPASPPSPLTPVSATEGDSLKAHLPPIETPPEAPPSSPSPSPPPRRASRSRKLVPPPTIIPPSNPAPRRKPPAVRNEPEKFAGMTITAFRQLTTANTTKNQEYLTTTLETEIVRIDGARPESPTTKVRTALQKSKEEADMQRSARAQRRARRSGEGIPEEEEPPSTPVSAAKHARGPGDDDDYKTPERKRTKFVDESGVTVEVEERRVRWDRGLSTVTYLDEIHPNGKAHSNFAIKKGCLASRSKALIEQLDPLGNIPNLDIPLDNLIPQNIVVKKFVYEDDPDVLPPTLAPDPAPAKATRSKSKSK